MRASRFQDLIVWQLANELAIEIVLLTRRSSLRADRRFCTQLAAAARSIPANIAEGFARFTPSEFARFLRIANGSLAEVQTYLVHALALGLVTDADYSKLSQLAVRIGAGLSSLIRYLQGPEAKNAHERATRSRGSHDRD